MATSTHLYCQKLLLLSIHRAVHQFAKQGLPFQRRTRPRSSFAPASDAQTHSQAGIKVRGGCLRVIQPSALFSDAEYKECLLTSPQVWREEQPACRRRRSWGCPGRWAPVWVRSKTCCSSRHPGVCGIFSPGTRNKVPTITVSLILLQILFSLIELITQREVSDAFCFVLLRQYLPKIQATHCFS